MTDEEEEKKNPHGDGPLNQDGDNIIYFEERAAQEKLRREEQEEQWRRQRKAEKKFATKSEPMFNLPPATKWLLGILILVHVVMIITLQKPMRMDLFETLGFVPGYYTVAGEFPGWPALIGPFTYMFLHGSTMHIIMNAVMLLAFGAGLERWIGGRKMLVLFYACSLVSLPLHMALNFSSLSPVIGASGGLSGMFGGVMYIMYKNGLMGKGRYGLLPIIGIWVVISIVFGMLGSPDGHPVAWAAHVGGFLAGLALIKPIIKYS